MKKLLAVLVGLVAAVLACGGWANASTTPSRWHTCVPQRTHYYGLWRVDNDLFTGSRGPSCITSTNGKNLKINTNYRPSWDGKVVAYPDIRFGKFYGSRDVYAQNYLPQRVRDTDGLKVHVTALGNAPGDWQADADVWFYNSNHIAGHGAAELVIVTRGSNNFRSSNIVTIGGQRFYESHWITSDNGKHWPLIYLRLVHPSNHTRLIMSQVMSKVHNLVGNGRWIGSIAYGAECWSGCKGLYLGMSVNH
jgi:hypothetical protein